MLYRRPHALTACWSGGVGVVACAYLSLTASAPSSTTGSESCSPPQETAPTHEPPPTLESEAALFPCRRMTQSEAWLRHTRTVIVVFDTNAVMQDPMCGGAVWQVLAHAPQSWSLQLMTSEVAVAEAVAGYSRAVAEAVAAFDKVARSWGRIGAQVQADSARDELQKKVHVYRDHLTESLREVGVAVLPPPDVSHMEVVARSVSRTRPCDDIGNGYRDTLIWLTVLQIASERSDEPVIFVTNDSDFMNSDRSGFHEDLVADLSSIGAEDRVGLRQALADVVIQLGAAPVEGLMRRSGSSCRRSVSRGLGVVRC